MLFGAVIAIYSMNSIITTDLITNIAICMVSQCKPNTSINIVIN